MGAWGTALYSDDTACDIRDTCNEVYALANPEEAEGIIFQEYHEILESAIIDNDYATFWYALADWQWNHGVLSEKVKDRATELLRVYTGIDEWADDPIRMQKRRAVLDALYQKIIAPQPPKKPPKLRLAKAKHQIGDVIIFQSCDPADDPDRNIWIVEHCTEPLIFADPEFEKAPAILQPPYNAHGKYMAILCVGKERHQHSQYSGQLFDEYSTYAFYDFISDVPPTLEELKKCGFLPDYLQYANTTGGRDISGWTYIFCLLGHNFRKGKYQTEEVVQVYRCNAEAVRFWELLSKKDYLHETRTTFTLFEAFGNFFQEKARLARIYRCVDNLLDPGIVNPKLKDPEEIDRLFLELCIKEVESQFNGGNHET